MERGHITVGDSPSVGRAEPNADGPSGAAMRPLDGIRVLEVAMYGFVPSAGAVLAEWGADVVKVEHAVTGDPQRGLRQTGLLRVEGDPNPNIEHANRASAASAWTCRCRKARKCSTSWLAARMSS